MTNTKRYIIGHRYGPQLDPRSQRRIETFLSEHETTKTLYRTQVGRYVMEMSEDQMLDFQHDNRQLVIEEDQVLQLFAMPGLPSRVPTEGPFSMSVSVKDANTGVPIANVTIYGIGKTVTYKAITNAEGMTTLQTGEQLLTRVIASARDSYWSQIIDNIKITGKKKLEIALKPLLLSGSYDWGKLTMGFHKVNSYWTGNEVKIGVIDSGISTDHQDLKPAGGYNTLDGEDPQKWNIDEKGHGTHVAGILVAKPDTRQILGGAPNAEIYSVKIFPGGYLSDLVEGVEWCIRNRMDIICLSLGVGEPSHVLAGVLRDAYDRGITCIAAIGNELTHVAFPAAYPTVIAVGAIGRFGTFPEDSAHILKVSQITDLRGGMFAANFTNFGPEVDVCAPGVAVLSTVPTGYAAWDGTSMACAMVSALGALILEAFPYLRTGDPQQPEAVRSILCQAAFNLGMPPYIQGCGLPLSPHALAAASPYPQRSFWNMPRGPSPATAGGTVSKTG